MPMFEQASHLIINQSTFVENTNINSAEPAFQYLYRHVAPGASHDSKDQYENPKCHPDTRKQLLSDIHEWIEVPEKETGITFLHGPAGAGKSCIARSACERAAKERLLGASFFFWRNSSARNNECRFITTIAYQLAEANVELKQHILSEVTNNPRIVDMPLEVQFQKLVLEPCSKVPRESLSVRAIVIDGLDECMGEEMQIGILQMLARAVRFEGFPLGFFITSRPELHLQEALDSKEVIFATKIISLNRIPGVSQDIRTVLESGFNRILNNPRLKRAMKSAPRPWPTPENIDQLVQRSSGQFIYAATVLKYVSDPDSNPASQLDVVLGIKEYEGSSSDSPFANLDRLYHQIMSRVKHPELSRKVLSYVLAIKDLRRRKIITLTDGDGKLTFAPDITWAVLHNQNRLLLVIEQLLELSEGVAYFALNQLHSLISLKVGSDSTRRQLEIDFYHKSFEDYLTTKKRSKALYVCLKNAHFELAESCLKFMGLPKYETEFQHVGWLYACFQWAVHTKFADTSKVEISSHDDSLQRFCSGWTDHLSIPNLNRALQVLGLSGGPWSIFYEHIQKFRLLALESIVVALRDVGRTLMRPGKGSTILASFNKRYTYPVWRKILKSYSNDTRSIKPFILVFYLCGQVTFGISESEACDILSALGLISDELERSSVLSRYADITQQLKFLRDGWRDLDKFIMAAEPHEAFHCTSEDISDVYAAIISTGVLRNHMYWICISWMENTEFTASSSLLSCLKSEALKFHDNRKLNWNLTYATENYFFTWLRKTVRGPTEDVIHAWERTFDRARSLFPDNFKLSGEIVPRK